MYETCIKFHKRNVVPCYIVDMKRYENEIYTHAIAMSGFAVQLAGITLELCRR